MADIRKKTDTPTIHQYVRFSKTYPMAAQWGDQKIVIMHLIWGSKWKLTLADKTTVEVDGNTKLILIDGKRPFIN